MRIRKKIFYPAGLISIALLPILCIWNLYHQKAFEKIGVLEVAYFYHNEHEEFSNIKTFNKSLSLRDYHHIEFTGNKQDDKIILQYAQIKLKNLIQSKDTITGVHFKFTEQAKYWAFVKAIDICQVEGFTPLMDKNDIWVAYYPPQPIVREDSYTIMFCGTNEMMNASILEAEKLVAFEKYLSKKLNYFIPLSLLFLLMCFFSFRKILRERFHRPPYS